MRASPTGVLFDAGRAEVGRVCIATERLSDLQKSIQAKQVYHLQNRHRNHTRLSLFFTLLKAYFKKKKNRFSSFELAKLAGNRKGWADLSQAMHLFDIRARAQSWAIFVAKEFGLANKQAFSTFLAVLVSSRATVKAHAYGARCKFIDCQA